MIARLHIIQQAKSWGSELSNAGFELKIDQLLKKVGQFLSLGRYLVPKLWGRLY